MKRAVIYARVSSARQRDEGTIESQLRELPEWANRLGIDVIETFADDGVSGAALLERRRGLTRMLDRLSKGDVSHVLVMDVDRFSRDTDLKTRGEIFGAIQRSRVLIAEYTTGVTHDLNSFIGRLFVDFRAELAAEWRQKHIINVRNGQATARARGWKPGGRTPYGLDFDKSSGFTVNQEEKAVIEEIFRRVLEGDSYQRIARSLNARGVPSGASRSAVRWSAGHIWRIVRKADYLCTGRWSHGGEQIDVPPIISPVIWQEVERTLVRRNQVVRPGTQRVYLAQGLGVCGLCGAKIRTQASSPNSSSGGRKYQYYVCVKRHDPKLEDDRCTLPYHRVDDADERLWRAVVALFSEHWHSYRESLRHAATVALEGEGDLKQSLRDARAEMARLEHVEAVLLARFGDGAISPAALDAELARLAEKRSKARDELAHAERGLGHAGLDLDALERIVDAVRERLPGAPPELRRSIIQELIPGTGPYRITFGTGGSLQARVVLSTLTFQSVRWG